MYFIDIDFHLIIFVNTCICTYAYLWLQQAVHTYVRSLWGPCVRMYVCLYAKQMPTELPEALLQTTCFPNLMIMSYLWVNTLVYVAER